MRRFILAATLLVVLSMGGLAAADDLAQVKERGVLRHLGIPYANFVTGSGDGLEVELTQKFAEHLGVKYEFVKTEWSTVIQDLTGKKVKPKGTEIEIIGEAPVKGDMIATGFTILPWREKAVDFSLPTFPSQIWLIARADSKIRPIKPSHSIEKDVAASKALMKGRSVLSMENTCLDPRLYNLAATGAKVICTKGQLNDMAPALLKGDAELTILDVPDALIALQKWPGKLKIIGPVSDKQQMAPAFAKDSPKLREAYNQFLAKVRKDGTYLRLINKYYPTARSFFPDFFKGIK
ncbi:MAG: transporter substrate-binding domain-containing protein [Geobacter sp.]|nr:transporter substrate-binding domain-containing protein [Geobacter sp.]